MLILSTGYTKEKIIQSKLLTRLGYNEWITHIDFIVTLIVTVYITFVNVT